MDRVTSAFVSVILVVIVYLVPTFVAIWRQHRQGVAITFLNVFLGWTLVGWVIALVWAVSSSEKVNK